MPRGAPGRSQRHAARSVETARSPATRSRAARRDHRDAYQQAVRRMAQRDYSASELRQTMLRDGYARAEIAAALKRLRAMGVVDDRSYAERYARRALAWRRLGTRRIELELRARGVAPDLAQRAPAVATQDLPEAEVLAVVVDRYWRAHARQEQRTRLRGLFAHLMRRGFGAALVSERLRALCPELEEQIDALAAAAEA